VWKSRFASRHTRSILDARPIDPENHSHNRSGHKPTMRSARAMRGQKGRTSDEPICRSARRLDSQGSTPIKTALPVLRPALSAPETGIYSSRQLRCVERRHRAAEVHRPTDCRVARRINPLLPRRSKQAESAFQNVAGREQHYKAYVDLVSDRRACTPRGKAPEASGFSISSRASWKGS
jgi:hypothetical protein